MSPRTSIPAQVQAIWREPIVAACLAVVVMAALGVGAARAQPTLPPPNALAPDQSVLAEYRIAPLDHISVTVFQVPDLTGDIAVDAAGQISLPLIGAMTAGGKTASELSKDIAAQLGAKYLQNPQVTVVVKDATGQRVTVEGAVMQPGVYPISGRTSLIQAIAMARGPDPTRANERRITVFRAVDGKNLTLTYNLAAIRAGKTPDPEILGNDVVIVFSSSPREMFHDLISASPLIALMRFY